MTNPATILRDSAIAGAVLTVAGGCFGGWDVAGAVAAGVLASLLNFGLLFRFVQGVQPGGAAVVQLRLLLKQLAGAALLVFLVARLPAAPVFVGFCSVLLGLAAQIFAPRRGAIRASEAG